MLRSTKQKFIAALVIVLIAAGGFSALWYAVFSFKEVVTARATASAAYSQKYAEMTALTKMLEDTEGDRAELVKFIITDEQVTSFLELVEAVAREQGLLATTRSIAVEPMKDTTAFETLSLTLETEGGYEGTVALSQILETMPYQVGIPSVSLDQMSDGGTAWRGVFLIRATKERKP